MLDFGRDDELTIQKGDLTAVNTKSTDTAKLRRGPSASNRGMLDDMRDAQQALKQFTEFTRDKLDTIDKQKRAKEEEKRAKSTLLSQHSVEVQPQKKQPQPATTAPAPVTPVDNTALYSEVKKPKPAANKAKKEETVTYQSVKKVVLAESRIPSNDYDELERPQKPHYVNQPLVNSQPTSPTVPKPSDSPPPSVPSYNPPQRDSFPLSNRAEYISEMITERFGAGDLGGDEGDGEHTAEPYLTPSSSNLQSVVESKKVVQKEVQQKKRIVKQKSGSSMQQARETSPPAKNTQKKTTKEVTASSKPTQRKASDTRVSPDPKPVARATSPSSKPFTKATSPGAKSSSRSPEPPPLKGFSPMRPYEGMDQKEPVKKEKHGSIKKIFRSISPKTKDPVSNDIVLMCVYCACILCVCGVGLATG